MNKNLIEILNVAIKAKAIAKLHNFIGIDVDPCNNIVKIHTTEETFKDLFGEDRPTDLEVLKNSKNNRHYTTVAGVEFFYLKEKKNEQ